MQSCVIGVVDIFSERDPFKVFGPIVEPISVLVVYRQLCGVSVAPRHRNEPMDKPVGHRPIFPKAGSIPTWAVTSPLDYPLLPDTAAISCGCCCFAGCSSYPAEVRGLVNAFVPRDWPPSLLVAAFCCGSITANQKGVRHRRSRRQAQERSRHRRTRFGMWVPTLAHRHSWSRRNGPYQRSSLRRSVCRPPCPSTPG